MTNNSNISGDTGVSLMSSLQYTENWLSPSEFARYLVSHCSDVPPLKGSRLLIQLERLSERDNLSKEQLLGLISSELSLEFISLGNQRKQDLYQVAPLMFGVCGDSFMPLAVFPKRVCSGDLEEGTKIALLNEQLPNKKLNKLMFVQTFLNQRYQRLVLFLMLGSVPVILTAISELLNQPLFDSIVPSGHVPAVLLIGVATLFFQGSAQIISGISQQSQSVFNSQVDLASKLATAQRFLNASSQDLPIRDPGSWRLTFTAASAFLGSLESLFISIPLALISLTVNLVVIGAYTDLASIEHLLLICLLPAALSLLISYLSSSISISLMGQQSRLETIIFSVVRSIQGIWMAGAENYFKDRFMVARNDMSRSLLRAGTFAATTDIIDKITTGLLYSFIYIEYYRSATIPSAHSASVGSLLVVYSAIGTVSASLNSISGDLVTIFQTLPTYWTPNAIRDIDSFVEPLALDSETSLQSIQIEDLTYHAPGIRGPFITPISLRLCIPGTIAICGPSGSGKSTLLKLLLGHLKPLNGHITLIDHQGHELSTALYQLDILVIGQELGFFGAQLRDVIDPSGEFDDNTLDQAAHKIGLMSVLEQLPLRWQTPISEYSRDLSLGQIQLFRLAKALLKRYKIIISDEPTCHLPEKDHLAALELLNANCDLHISVLHRSSGLTCFSRILTISQSGDVSFVEQGER